MAHRAIGKIEVPNTKKCGFSVKNSFLMKTSIWNLKNSRTFIGSKTIAFFN